MLGLIYLLRRSANAGAGGILGAFGQSRARVYDAERPGTTFADVAGIDEVREAGGLVDFLRSRRVQAAGELPRRLAHRIRNGQDAPGARRTGGKKVPFFSQSASEFVEAIVGVGASRVRDLFEKARKAAPAIIFIDELDAIGRSRSSGLRLGSNDEQEQTLNQILTEMGRFRGRDGSHRPVGNEPC